MLSKGLRRRGSRSLPDFAIQAGMLYKKHSVIEFTLRVPQGDSTVLIINEMIVMLSKGLRWRGSRSLPDFAIQAGMLYKKHSVIEFTLRVPQGDSRP